MCKTGNVHLAASVPDCGCECGPGFRRFFSRKEEKECLETYRAQLEKELKGVDERIGEIEKK